MHVEMSIARFLPTGADRSVVNVLKALAESEMASTTVIDIGGGGGGDDADEAIVLTAQRLKARVLESPLTRAVTSGVSEAEQVEIMRFLTSFPPSAFLPVSSYEPEKIQEEIASLKSELGGPLGPMVRALAPNDPLGGVIGLLNKLRDSQGAGLTSSDGILTSSDGSHAFLFFRTNGSAFDAPLQREAFAMIHRTFDEVRTSPEQRLEMSGIGRFTVHSEEQIRGDIERISTLSMIGILGFFALLFRSFRMLMLGLVPVAFGTIVATLGSYWIFGEVHGLTLAFGTSLLGVGIDYAEHYFTHFALEPEKGGHAIMRLVWPGLWLGALTTVAGFIGIGWADFPGAIEIALFASLAVIGSLVATRFLLPPWMPTNYARPKLLEALERHAASIVNALARRKHIAVVAFVALALLAFGLVRVRFIDDMSALLALDPALTAEDARVHQRVTSSEPGRFAIVVGDTEELASEKLDLATAELERAKREGVIKYAMPIGALIRSEQAQRASFLAAQASGPRIDEALAANGFRPELFHTTESGTSPKFVTLAEVIKSPLGSVVGPLAPKLEGRQAFVIPLGGISSMAELRKYVPDAIIVDERALLEETYGHVRQRVVQLVGLSLVFVWAIVLVKYRSLRLSIAALLPALIAATFTISVFGWCGVKLNIFHVVGLLLVLSMGVDYGIFIVEGRHSPYESARSLVSVFAATLTTLLSFGALALSVSPVLCAIGLTITIGLTASLILCPGALVLWAHRAEERHS